MGVGLNGYKFKNNTILNAGNFGTLKIDPRIFSTFK